MDFQLTENFVFEATKNALIVEQPIMLQRSILEFWNAFERKTTAISGLEVYFDDALVSQVGNLKSKASFFEVEQARCISSTQQNTCIYFYIDSIRFLAQVLYLLCAVFLSAVAAYFIRLRVVRKSIAALVLPLESEIEKISSFSGNVEKIQSSDWMLSSQINSTNDSGLPIREVSLLSGAYRDLLIQSKKYLELNKSIELSKSLSILAAQVAHDIRSPLSALNMVSSTLSNVAEEKRILMRNAIQRINDIANDLISKSKLDVKTGFDSSGADSNSIRSVVSKEVCDTVLLSNLIDSIFSEKRIQFRDKSGIHLEADVNHAYGIFCKINANEFARVISNLINNSVEAFPDENGKITLFIRKYGEQVSIIIHDNGKGIPPEILGSLGERGVSHGKEGTQSGSGLGIWHAKRTIESFGGQFNITSKVAQGTQITINLPMVDSPSWFQPSLKLAVKQKIICLDDDVSIHGIWRGRIESLNAMENQFKFSSFTSGIEFKKYIQQSNIDAKTTLVLLDFELLNQPQTGLDIIEELKLNRNKSYQIILVTSRFDESHIRIKCENMGIKMIPKNMAGFVPIEVSQ